MAATQEVKLGEKTRLQAGQRHHLTVQRPVPVSLVLRDDNGEPLANCAYTFEVDGQPFEGTTDANGALTHDVPPDAKTGKLVAKPEGADELEWELELRELEGVSDVKGLQARLNNLGFDCEITGSLDDATKAALEDFQEAIGHDKPGELDEDTKAALDLLSKEEA